MLRNKSYPEANNVIYEIGKDAEGYFLLNENSEYTATGLTLKDVLLLIELENAEELANA